MSKKRNRKKMNIDNPVTPISDSAFIGENIFKSVQDLRLFIESYQKKKEPKLVLVDNFKYLYWFFLVTNILALSVSIIGIVIGVCDISIEIISSVFVMASLTSIFFFAVADIPPLLQETQMLLTAITKRRNKFFIPVSFLMK